MLDLKQRAVVALIALAGGRMDSEDGLLAPYSGDRGDKTDTLNLLFDRGYLVQTGSEDTFTIRLGRG